MPVVIVNDATLAHLGGKITRCVTIQAPRHSLLLKLGVVEGEHPIRYASLQAIYEKHPSYFWVDGLDGEDLELAAILRQMAKKSGLSPREILEEIKNALKG